MASRLSCGATITTIPLTTLTIRQSGGRRQAYLTGSICNCGCHRTTHITVHACNGFVAADHHHTYPPRSLRSAQASRARHPFTTGWLLRRLFGVPATSMVSGACVVIFHGSLDVWRKLRRKRRLQQRSRIAPGALLLQAPCLRGGWCPGTLLPSITIPERCPAVPSILFTVLQVKLQEVQSPSSMHRAGRGASPHHAAKPRTSSRAVAR